MTTLPFRHRAQDLVMTASVVRRPNDTSGPDQPLWTMRSPKGTLVAAVTREIRNGTGQWDDLVGIELRILQAGDLYLTELYKHLAGLDRRARATRRIYQGERNHQGLHNRLLAPEPTGPPTAAVRCRTRLGGLLRYYYRAA